MFQVTSHDVREETNLLDPRLPPLTLQGHFPIFAVVSNIKQFQVKSPRGIYCEPVKKETFLHFPFIAFLFLKYCTGSRKKYSPPSPSSSHNQHSIPQLLKVHGLQDFSDILSSVTWGGFV